MQSRQPDTEPVDELGTLGSVDIPSTVRRRLGVGMVGHFYRLEWVEVAGGTASVLPYDDRLFASQREAYAAHRTAKAKLIELAPELYCLLKDAAPFVWNARLHPRIQSVLTAALTEQVS